MGDCERECAYVTRGGGASPWQVVIYVRRLHPTKGWRTEYRRIEPFTSLVLAKAYAALVAKGRAAYGKETGDAVE